MIKVGNVTIIKKHCRPPRNLNERLNRLLLSLTPDEHSALQKKLEQGKKFQKSKYGISFYEQTYALPFYYTVQPDQAVYGNTIPDNKSLLNEEFKAQVNLLVPIWISIFHSHYSSDASYT